MKDDSIAVETVFNFKPNDSQADTPLTAAIGAAVRQLFPQAVVVDDLQPSFTDGIGFVIKALPVMAFLSSP